MVTKLDFNLPCPACKGPLSPRVMACTTCGIKVEGPFALNEFTGLGSDLLHFLRIFVHCEGRIKDMEKALGVSYPTVKATMGRLKAALNMPDGAETPEAAPEGEPETPSLNILQAMERGEISYQDALKSLKRAKKPKGSRDEG